MEFENKSIVVFEPSDVINNMALLTPLCLFHDEILLFGSKPLETEKERLRDLIDNKNQESAEIQNRLNFFERTFEPLKDAGLMSYYGSKETAGRFPKSNELELNFNIGTEEHNGETKIVIKDLAETPNDLTKRLFSSFAHHSRPVTVSDVIRQVNLFGVAQAYRLPLVTEKNLWQGQATKAGANIELLKNNLAYLSLRNLAMPYLSAYSPEDIIHARKELKYELLEFKAAITDLTWLVRQNTRDTDDVRVVVQECEALIETKVTSALSSLEAKIQKHNDNRMKRMLVASGKVMLEVGKAFLAPSPPAMLVGAGGVLLAAAGEMERQPAPELQIASLIYKLKERATS